MKIHAVVSRHLQCRDGASRVPLGQAMFHKSDINHYLVIIYPCVVTPVVFLTMITVAVLGVTMPKFPTGRLRVQVIDLWEVE